MTNILSTDGIHTLHHTFFDPANDTKATLLIVHGMAEHSERYVCFAQYLADNGIAVLTYDQLGHGRSVKNADELGFFAKKHPVQMVQRDVINMADALKARHPDAPHFIMGHSMGSFIVRTILQHHSSEFAGAILMGTSDTDHIAKAMQPLCSMLNHTNPKKKNKLFGKITNKTLNAKLKEKTKHEFAWVSKNEANLAEYDADPLCGFDFTNNGYWTLFQFMNKGLSKDWAKTVDKDFPLLFVRGAQDPVGNMSKGVQKVADRLKSQGFERVEVRLYPDMRHEPLHEAENEMVYEEILGWLELYAQAV